MLDTSAFIPIIIAYIHFMLNILHVTTILKTNTKFKLPRSQKCTLTINLIARWVFYVIDSQLSSFILGWRDSGLVYKKSQNRSKAPPVARAE